MKEKKWLRTFVGPVCEILCIYKVEGPSVFSPSLWGSLAWKTLKTPVLHIYDFYPRVDWLPLSCVSCAGVLVCPPYLCQSGSSLARWQQRALHRASRSRVCWQLLSQCWTGAQLPPQPLGASGSDEGLETMRVSAH